MPTPAARTILCLGSAALLLAGACGQPKTDAAPTSDAPAAPPPPPTPVELHGQLRVEGTRLVDACGRPVQLAGVSHFWHPWEGKEHWNGQVVAWLRDDWRVSVVRAPLAVDPNLEGDYLTDPANSLLQLRQLVEGAIHEGVYVIVDFHAHNNYSEAAKEVLGTIARDYGQHPNVLYEIWNEPIGTQENPSRTWREIKTYAGEVIPAIRAADPDNVIVVPTPFYDQFPDVAAADPITEADLGQPADNLLYDVHVYAGQHKGVIRARADSALAQGLPLIMTEVGRDGVNWGPNNIVDSVSFDAWVRWIDAHGISFTKWSLSSRNETGSSLQPSAAATGGWTAVDLTTEGRYNRAFFRERGARFYAEAACD